MTETAAAMQHRADLIEKANSQGARPQMTRQMNTAQLEDFLAYAEEGYRQPLVDLDAFEANYDCAVDPKINRTRYAEVVNKLLAVAPALAAELRIAREGVGRLGERNAELTDALAREHDALAVLQAWLKQGGGGNAVAIARIVNEGYAAGCAIFDHGTCAHPEDRIKQGDHGETYCEACGIRLSYPGQEVDEAGNILWDEESV